MTRLKEWDSHSRQWSEVHGVFKTMRLVRHDLDGHGPFQVDGGQERGLVDTMRHVRAKARKLQVGEFIEVIGQNEPFVKASPRRVLLKAVPGESTQGGLVAEAALSQLGVDYVWADADPKGGASSGFDCSGLTMWAYSQVGVSLPHSAELQRQQAERFEEPAKLVRGDLIFYHTGRLPSGEADHVGIYTGLQNGVRMVCDASSGLDEVVSRNYDANPILVFGRIAKVNGPL